MQIEVKAMPRSVQGRSASRRLRRSGFVPGIVYGGEAAPVQIELDHNDLFHQLKHEAFHSSILTLSIDGAKEMVLLRDVQHHAYKQKVMHIDFQRVSDKEKIHVKVPLHFINQDIAPGVKLAHGIVNHLLTEVDVRCLPKDLPEYIEVDIAELQAGHSIHLSQLKLPEGLEIIDLQHGDDKGVVTITSRGGPAATEEGSAEA